jgi:hypothetical protein
VIILDENIFADQRDLLQERSSPCGKSALTWRKKGWATSKSSHSCISSLAPRFSPATRIFFAASFVMTDIAWFG